MWERSVGILYNDGKDGVLDIVARLTRVLEASGVLPIVAEPLQGAGRAANFAGCEFLCVLGGDGTLLSALDVALPLDLSDKAALDAFCEAREGESVDDAGGGPLQAR